MFFGEKCRFFGKSLTNRLYSEITPSTPKIKLANYSEVAEGIAPVEFGEFKALTEADSPQQPSSTFPLPLPVLEYSPHLPPYLLLFY